MNTERKDVAGEEKEESWSTRSTNSTGSIGSTSFPNELEQTMAEHRMEKGATSVPIPPHIQMLSHLQKFFIPFSFSANEPNVAYQVQS